MAQAFVSGAGSLGAILIDCAEGVVWTEFVEAEAGAAAGDAGVAKRVASSQPADAARPYSTARMKVI
jgi:hypothetical protein